MVDFVDDKDVGIDPLDDGGRRQNLGISPNAVGIQIRERLGGQLADIEQRHADAQGIAHVIAVPVDFSAVSPAQADRPIIVPIMIEADFMGAAKEDRNHIYCTKSISLSMDDCG